MAIQLLLEANPSWTVISLDISNAFNEIKRTAVLEALWENLALRPLWYYNFRCKTVNGFVGLGYGPSMEPAPFTCSEGEKQGDMESMPNFCLGIDKVNKATLSSLKSKGGWLVAGADDTYFLGPPSIVFPEVSPHADRLRSIGLHLNLSKMKSYIAPQYRTEDHYHLYRRQANIPEGILPSITDPSTSLFGLKAYGIPIGDPTFVSSWLSSKARHISSEITLIGETLDPTAISPQEIPTRQCLWLLLLTYM
jgi:hypothetical protein